MTIENNVELTEQPQQQQQHQQQEEDNSKENPTVEGSQTLDAPNESGDQDEDDDITVIILDQTADNGMDQNGTLGWADQDSPEMEERRRNILLHELQRVQRASFIHFMILCLIPTSLLFIVIATVLGEDKECESLATECRLEARTFINAFTTRCICEAITVSVAQP